MRSCVQNWIAPSFCVSLNCAWKPHPDEEKWINPYPTLLLFFYYKSFKIKTPGRAVDTGWNGIVSCAVSQWQEGLGVVDKVLQGKKCCFLFQQQEAKTFDWRVTEFCKIAELSAEWQHSAWQKSVIFFFFSRANRQFRWTQPSTRGEVQRILPEGILTKNINPWFHISGSPIYECEHTQH